MKMLSLMFLGTLTAIPVIGEITPEGAFDALSVGTAQCVLAMVAVVEFLAIGFMFSIWRRDIAKDRASDKENSTILVELLFKNSVALSDNAQSSHRQAKSLDALERSVSGFTAVVSKCEKK